VRVLASRAMSSIESAPASIPATREETFSPAFAPLSMRTDNHASASSRSPTDPADRINGRSPATDTRFGSTNETDTAAGPWETCIYKMRLCETENLTVVSHISFIRRAFSL
jgi:hypothetical protein